MSYMRSVAVHTAGFVQAPTLRLLAREDSTMQPASGRLRLLGADGPSGSAPREQPVLLAGGAQSARTAVLSELAESMPPSTSFEQAGAIWEVLARAPQSKMVILSGELEGIPAQSLMQMLGHRHPQVPVVCLDELASAAA
jgi:hypothetical protein